MYLSSSDTVSTSCGRVNNGEDARRPTSCQLCFSDRDHAPFLHLRQAASRQHDRR